MEKLTNLEIDEYVERYCDKCENQLDIDDCNRFGYTSSDSIRKCWETQAFVKIIDTKNCLEQKKITDF